MSEHEELSKALRAADRTLGRPEVTDADILAAAPDMYDLVVAQNKRIEELLQRIVELEADRD